MTLLVAGLDIGRRADFSALVVVDAATRAITGGYRLRQASYTSQIRSILPMIRSVEMIGLDRSGVGDGVVELLPRGLPVMPVVINGGPNFAMKPDGTCVAGKAGLVQLLRVSGLTMAPGAPGRGELLQEMASFVFKGDGRMEAAGKGHDDLVLAAALAALAAAQVLKQREPANSGGP
jgi:hypothetical protein